jgi:hypothetical protein
MVADTYTYQWVSGAFKKNGTINNFSDAELYLLVANYESNSFCSQVVNIIIDDLQYNIDTQQSIEDDTNSTPEQVTNARTARFKFKAMKDALDTYKKDFLNWSILTGEIMALLKVLLAVNE